MNYVFKAIFYGSIFTIFFGFLAVAVFVRLAPNDPTLWNVAIEGGTPAIPGPCAEQVRSVVKGALATCLLRGTPEQVLARLNAIVLATARTHSVAGQADQGRMTWLARTLIMGFPDYITAEATQTGDGTKLAVYSRQRYGRGDWGVNAARLTSWLATLDRE